LAKRKENFLEEKLKSLFKDYELRKLALETGCVKRFRKIDIVALFWTLVLGFNSGICRSIASFRSNYEIATGTRLSRSSFYNRFTLELVKFLKKVLERLCQTQCEPLQELKGRLNYFYDLVVADSTVLHLHDLLEKNYPSSRNGKGRGKVKSSAKVHVMISANAPAPRVITITGEREDDRSYLKIGPWLKDRLLLVDLGYFKYKLFHQINSYGGYFVSRLFGSSNPLITKDNLAGEEGSPLVGKTIKEILKFMKGDTFDVEAEMKLSYTSKSKGKVPDKRSKRRKRRDRKASKKCPNIRTVRFRIVGVWNPENGKYHCYITNILDISVLSAEEISNVYRCRWEIELIFKELKSYYRLDQFDTEKKEVVDALIYVAIISLTVSRKLWHDLKVAANIPWNRCPRRLFTARFAEICQILHVLIFARSINEIFDRLLEHLKRGMVEPYNKRAEFTRLRGY